MLFKAVAERGKNSIQIIRALLLVLVIFAALFASGGAAEVAPAPDNDNQKIFKADALITKNVSLKLENASIKGKEKVILDNYGKKNPLSVQLPGNAVKFVEISVENIFFSSATVTIQYSDSELDGADENFLTIYHWNGAIWEALPTTIDAENNLLAATTTSLSPFGVSAGEGGQARVLVATNRYVILDDPITGSVGAGFVNPGNNYNTWNYWSGKNTRINATALYLDKNGTPVQGINITFTLRNPGGGINATNYSITDSRGLADFSFDLNAANYYGKWNVSARNGSFGMNYTFIYNWWGCATSDGVCSDATHFGGNPTTEGTTIANSPYLSGRDRTTAAVNEHSLYSCTACHQSFDGLSGGNVLTANHTNYTRDVHRNISCTNAGCHGNYTTHSWRNAGGTKFYSNMVIASCYNTSGGCHTPANRSDISNKSTLNQTYNVSNATSLYSINSTAFQATFHTPNSTVPCIICHGPMHNISKPDITQNFTRNKETESSQCITCHSSYQMHNASVNCTVCHSDDVHLIQVFAQNATYITLNKSSPNPARGNCTNCHQNATFLLDLTKNPKAGYHDNNSLPAKQINVPMNHSNDINAGKKWNSTPGYWTNGTSGSAQNTSCNYCHGKTMHNTSALGRPSLFKGSNIVNSTISSSTYWCAACHYQFYSSGANTYNDTVRTFNFPGEPLLVPPEITGNASFGANQSNPAYFNHSGFSTYADSKCDECHPTSSTTITAFVHNVPVGSAGDVNCTNCHNVGGSQNNVNFTAVNLSMHANLNKNATSTPEKASNKPCWGCHGTKNGTWANESDQPIGQHNATQYKNPRKCYECHITGILQFNAVNVTDHIPSGYTSLTDVNTSSYNNTYCSYCHNNSVNNGYDSSMGLSSGGSPINASVSHYGANTTANKLMSAANKSSDCVYCHRNNSNMLTWGILSTSRANISNKNGSTGTGTNHSSYTTNSTCRYCHGNYTVTASFTFHEASIGNGSFGPDCKSCHDIGGIAPAKLNFSAVNDSEAIHKDLNKNASATVDIENKKCWACHTANGTEPKEGDSHDVVDRYTNPYNCTDCHLQGAGQNLNYTPGAILNVTQHYLSGNSIKTPGAASCYACHNKSGMMINASDPDSGTGAVYGGANGGNNSTSHYGKKRSDLAVQQNSTQYCSNCHNGSSVFPFIDEANRTIANHSLNYPGTNPSCKECHGYGRIHNLTLYESDLDPLPNSSYCLSCHGLNTSSGGTNYSNAVTGVKNEHNGSVECTKCHLNTSRSIHPVTYLQQDASNFSTSKASAVNCTNCHQVKLTNFSTAPIIPNTLKHSSNLSNGSLWNSTSTPFWTTGIGSCYYCHNDTKHNLSALGDVSRLLSDSNNSKNGAITATTWCIDCHYNVSNANYKGNQWTPVPPLITVNNTGRNNWENHSGYLSSGIKDSNCKSCHALNGSYTETSLNYSHSLDEGVAGGPNCISCHNLAEGLGGGAPAGINFTSFNQSVHFSMNSNNATNQGYAPVVGACWACHDSDGNVTSGHPDRYKAPKTCTECHLGTGTYNASAYGALVVYEHYFSGVEIHAGNSSSNIASCINCHENVSEMLLYNNDTDTGSFTGDGIMQNGGNTSAYHYGKPRPDLRTGTGSRESKCLYCHQNLSTAFIIAMQKQGLSERIENHTDNPAQRCATCHGTNSWLHNNSLTIPNSGIVDNDYCISCHSAGVGGTRPIPETHNSIGVNCWNCHQNPNTSENPMYLTPIHGMMYAQTNGSYSRHIKNAPANCTTCHVYNLVNTSNNYATIVPPLNHSTDSYAGKKWGSYWDNTSMITSCYYCHQSEPHKLNSALLGNISTIKGSNQYKSSDLVNSRWCAACHNNDSTSNYQGSILNPIPPEILNRTGTVPATANDGTSFYNHSSDVAANSNDSKCTDCHALVGSYQVTTQNYSHSLSEGGGGTDCVSSGCHGSVGSPTSPYMNWTSLKQGMHAKLNSEATNTTALTDTIDKACWACHGDGTEPSGHPTKYKTPYYCTDCHLASGSIAGKYNATNVTEHQHVDAQVLTNSSYARCESCHNNSLVNYKDNETNTLTNYTLGNVSHYGANKTAGKLMEPTINSTDCVYCHLNNSNREKWANATNASATKPDIHGSFNSTTQSSKCWECHVDGGVATVTANFTLHNASLNPGASEFCLTCHVSGGTAQNLNITGERMGAHINLNSTPANTLNNSDCWSCHFGYPNGTSGSHSYNVSRQNTYYCEDCHGPNKNETAKSRGIAAMTKNITNFVHGTTRATSIGCEACHVANETRKPAGTRVKIYHNDSAKKNASGVVSNPGWDMIDGSSTGCMDCHRVQNSQDAPFRAPGVAHYITQSRDCGSNCHSSSGNKTNPHYQFYLPCTTATKGIPCTPTSSVSPPEVLNLNLSVPRVQKGVSTNLTALARDNYNAIENARYRILNSSGLVVNWTQMNPAGTGNEWGPYRSEHIEAVIDTSSLSPGNYTIEVISMAGGPRTSVVRMYPDYGEWSPVYSIDLEVTT